MQHLRIDDIKEFHPDKRDFIKTLAGSEKILAKTVCFEKGRLAEHVEREKAIF